MFLKRLEIRGFKSFADKIELEFPQGITAVVGPNGSGKSNISDAVRWVLGEQSAKSLRGQKMEDVIFAGSDSRKAINFAEVTLVLDNEQQDLPLEYSEVAVTRKVYRSGESEYMINNQNCRLKDITELFMDTGLGKEAYSIIGQGRIEEILSTKSEERRGIFEEAAGIVKYKTRRREAEKRLQETEDNLTRVHDIINELEGQIDPLQEASEKAEMYLQLKSQLRRVDISLYAYQIDRIDKECQVLLQEKAQLNEALQNLSAEIHTKDADYTEMRWNLSKCEQTLDQLQQQYTEVSTQLEKAMGDKNVLLEREKNLRLSAESLAGEVEEIQQIILTKQGSAETKQGDFRQLQLQFEDKKRELQAQIDQLEQYERQLHNQDASTETLKADLIEILHEQTTVKNNIHHLNQGIAGTEAKISELLRQKEALIQQISHVEQQVKQMQVQIDDSQQHLHAAKSEYQTRQADWEKQQAALEQMLRQQQQQTQLLHARIDRKQLLSDMESEFAGYFQGTKEILLAKNRQTSEWNGVRGAVVDLIEVPRKYETAVETALGNALQYIVVDHEQTAQTCIQYLKSRSRGRATFLPMSIIEANARKYPVCEGNRGFIGYANEIVTTPQEYRHIVDNLLGNVIIADDIQTATEIARKASYRCRVVTLEGDYINPGGAMTGGSSQKKAVSIMSRKNEVNALKKEIAEMEKQLAVYAEQCKQKEQAVNEIKESIESVKLNIETIQATQLELNAQLQKHEQEMQYRQENLQMLLQEEQHYAEQIAALRQNKLDADQRLTQLLSEQQEIEVTLQSSQQRLKESTVEKDSASSKITELRIELAKYEEQINTLQEIHQRDVQELQELQEREARLCKNIEQQQSQNHEVQARAAELEQTILSENAKKEQLQQEIEQMRVTRRRMQDEISAAESNINELSQQAKKLERHIQQLEVKENRFDVELNNALEQLQQEYEISFERALEEYPLEGGVEESKTFVKQLKDKISALGNVNLGAIEEYQRVHERYHFLKNQREDLLEAIHKLYQVISEMNEEMERRFIDSFNQIRYSFSEVFQQMFGGGRANLQLTDSDNVLTSGIEIFAEPPGKKLQHLSLLSGGERALTAIALLFAILRITPVPFCILDEVEAALDESNVTRFANYLRQFSEQTQFIVVTHRKGTMEAADVLYGVTMEGTGVSKMVSVRLEDVIALDVEQVEAS